MFAILLLLGGCCPALSCYAASTFSASTKAGLHQCDSRVAPMPKQDCIKAIAGLRQCESRAALKPKQGSANAKAV